MMATATIRNPALEQRVFEATAHLLIEKGARNLRTAEIASLAGIPESTLFRNFGRVSELLPEVNQWAWRRVSERVAKSAFSRPVNTAREALLADVRAILEMRDVRVDAIAAAFAFLFHGRSRELEVPSSAELREFEHRLLVLCQRLLPDGDAGADAELAELASVLLMNYLATVWMTWDVIGAGGNTGKRDVLSPAVAEAGVAGLVDRVLAMSTT